ncbi:NADP-dependent oxidoreductase domain-containing protein [Mortierella sp. GBAus27b]|nr:NADP-dependent oxidoreductase domain-containing protein [Mortierella sp. GBAus27b]
MSASSSHPQAGVLYVNGVPTSETRLTLGGAISVSPMAIGTWAWGDSKWGYKPEMFDDIAATWDALQEDTSGINFFDTAELYGKGESERIIGRLMKKTAGEGKTVPIVATKFIPFPWKVRFPASLLNALKDSIKRLGVPVVDLYQIHGPISLRSIEVLADALAESVKLGLVKIVGVSNYSIDEVVRMHTALAKHGIPLASNQVEFSLLRRLPETSGMIAKCHELGVAVLAYSPLGMGRLSGKYSANNPPPSNRNFANYPMTELVPLLGVMEKISKAHSKPMTAVAINWTICKGTIPLGGARNPEQARQNAQALGWRLSEQEIAELDSVAMIGSTGGFWQHG